MIFLPQGPECCGYRLHYSFQNLLDFLALVVHTFNPSRDMEAVSFKAAYST